MKPKTEYMHGYDDAFTMIALAAGVTAKALYEGLGPRKLVEAIRSKTVDFSYSDVFDKGRATGHAAALLEVAAAADVAARPTAKELVEAIRTVSQAENRTFLSELSLDLSGKSTLKLLTVDGVEVEVPIFAGPKNDFGRMFTVQELRDAVRKGRERVAKQAAQQAEREPLQCQFRTSRPSASAVTSSVAFFEAENRLLRDECTRLRKVADDAVAKFVAEWDRRVDEAAERPKDTSSLPSNTADEADNFIALAMKYGEPQGHGVKVTLRPEDVERAKAGVWTISYSVREGSTTWTWREADRPVEQLPPRPPVELFTTRPLVKNNGHWEVRGEVCRYFLSNGPLPTSFIAARLRSGFRAGTGEPIYQCNADLSLRPFTVAECNAWTPERKRVEFEARGGTAINGEANLVRLATDWVEPKAVVPRWWASRRKGLLPTIWRALGDFVEYGDPFPKNKIVWRQSVRSKPSELDAGYCGAIPFSTHAEAVAYAMGGEK